MAVLASSLNLLTQELVLCKTHVGFTVAELLSYVDGPGWQLVQGNAAVQVYTTKC